jgi:hypothetical protein
MESQAEERQKCIEVHGTRWQTRKVKVKVKNEHMSYVRSTCVCRERLGKISSKPSEFRQASLKIRNSNTLHE